MILLASCTTNCSALAQCQLRGPNPSVAVEIVASAIGQKGLGGAVIAMGASCPGETNAHVKFKLDTARTVAAGLIVSPSSGTTPIEVQVGVDPSAAGAAFPVQVSRQLEFTTVDQSPPSISPVVVRITFTTPDPPIVRSVVNAASLAPVINPGAVVLIRGISLSPNLSATLDQTGVYPTTLGNTASHLQRNPCPAALFQFHADQGCSALRN